MVDEDSDALVERLTRLERAQRSLRTIIASLSILWITSLLLLATWVMRRSERHARFDTIEAAHFVIRDSTGERRGELGMWSGISRLALGGDEVVPRIVMGVSRGVGAQFDLRNSDGASVHMMGTPFLGLSGGLGFGAAIEVEGARGGRLYLHDSSGSMVVLPDSFQRKH